MCRVWAPGKKSLELILDRGESSAFIPMGAENNGYWSVTVPDATPGLKYSFRVNGKERYPDPASRSQPEDVHGPSAIVSRDFEWNDQHWKGISRGEMVIYEVHTGTFSEGGNFDGIIARLPYLLELGINAIELMPVAQFPGSRNWGYDGVFPFAVQHSYGGVNGLKRLVNAAHEAGIAIILDVVYNHTGPEGSCLHAFGPYFIDKYKTPWGPVVNLDDAWSFGVRDYFTQNALMWLEEFHIDGLRMDAVHAMMDNSAVHFMEELQQEVKKLEVRSGTKKVLIAELDLNNPRYINPVNEGGFGLDAQWVDEFHHALHSILTGETDGYYSDFGNIEHMEKAVRDTYVYTGEFSVHRKRNFGRPVNNSFDQFIVFAQNHDHIGNRMFGERLPSLVSFEGLKLAAAAVLLSPYIPLLFMGEEYGEKNPFLYFISHTDEKLVEMVRKGRKEEFSYFNWAGDPPDPFAEDTFQRSIPNWESGTEEAGNLLEFHRQLISLRKGKSCLRNPARDSLYVYPTAKGSVLAYERSDEYGTLMVILNFGKEIAEFRSERFSGEKIFDSADIKWKGPGGSEASATELSIKMKPLSAVIIEK